MKDYIIEIDQIDDISEIGEKEKLNTATFALLSSFSVVCDEIKALLAQLLLRVVEKIRQSISEGNTTSSAKNVCKKFLYYFLVFCSLAEQNYKASSVVIEQGANNHNY